MDDETSGVLRPLKMPPSTVFSNVVGVVVIAIYLASFAACIAAAVAALRYLERVLA